ncbi:O-antigen ligase [Robiginitalea sp. SC105]|uniref:O-antigen ligase family protein n=1 Tax=Robiginitalea sp. SC105 TaxID=2762332 RepID=UPI00163AD232|nr:O-antigen ligase family protein [Robiginitalea sp. SC105]MBC2838237.1 O-antigen ligase family protein [Robiginitalea sp. SC105]
MVKKNNIQDLMTSFFLFSAVFFLPLKTGLSNFGIIGLLTTTFFAFYRSGLRPLRAFRPWIYMGLPWLLFLPLLVGGLYTPFPENLPGQLVKLVFYILLPLVIFRKDLLKNRAKRIAASGMILGAVASATYLLIRNTIEFMDAGVAFRGLLSYQFTGKNFVEPLAEMHPVYLGSYYLFAAVLVWLSDLHLSIRLKWVVTVLLVVAIFFVNSRSILALTALMSFTVVYRLLGRKYVLGAILACIAALLFALPVIRDTYVFKKFSDGTIWELEKNVGISNTDADNPSDSRMSRWLASWEIYIDKPYLGHGTGSARELLLKAYTEKGMDASLRQQYDSHNQFLAYAMEFGVVGILSILSFFLVNLFWALRHGDGLMGTFTFLVFVICLTENYLIRNMGVNFVALWIVIFHLKTDD